MVLTEREGEELQGEMFIAYWPQSRHSHTYLQWQQAYEAGVLAPFTNREAASERPGTQLVKWTKDSPTELSGKDISCT